jgi:vacuolar-type H+-ATPase subunit H
MENVWSELKKIEAQAEQITSEAQNKAKQIAAMSQQQAQKIIDDSKVNAEAEAQKLFNDAVAKANEEREKQLKGNQAEITKLKVNANKRMDQAVNTIVNTVLEEN